MNFGITVMIALIVGTVVPGQTFYIFTIENLKQFGALKAIGVTNRRIITMILLQAVIVGGTGYALGMGMAAAFFASFLNYLPTRGIVLPWEVMAAIAVVVLLVVGLASLMSVRRGARPGTRGGFPRLDGCLQMESLSVSLKSNEGVRPWGHTGSCPAWS